MSLCLLHMHGVMERNGFTQGLSDDKGGTLQRHTNTQLSIASAYERGFTSSILSASLSDDCISMYI
jgi:hypothetical protein